ncbi:MAG: epoxyqueuosine reductase [Clostridia bacterium]
MQAKPEGLRNLISAWAAALGFAAMGVAGVDPLPEWDREVERRVREGVILPAQRHRYLGRLRSDPKHVMPEAGSILVLVRPYAPFVSPFPRGVAGYPAHYRAYPEGHEAAQQLAAELERMGIRAVAGPGLPVKALAVRAGLGPYGRNSLIHCREFGSFVTIHTIVTDAVLEPDAPSGMFDCGACSACVRACPTGALQQTGAVVNLARCVRAYMNSGEVVPVELRAAYGTNILGCDACQRCCPHNAGAMSRASEPPAEDLEVFSLAGILGDDTDERRTRLDRMKRILGSNYAKENRVLADAAVAAGNTRDSGLLEPLAKALSHPHEPVRAHAAWAIGMIGGSAGARLLEKALSAETSERVVDEIEHALERCG